MCFWLAVDIKMLFFKINILTFFAIFEQLANGEVSLSFLKITNYTSMVIINISFLAF